MSDRKIHPLPKFDRWYMADIFTPEKRSWVMSRIRSRNTGIERRMRTILRENRLHYRSYPKMYGSPDFLVEKRLLVFCDGDFWHGYDRKKRLPKKFWRDKIEGNMRRDRTVTRRLRTGGWSVVRLWEHDIVKKPGMCLKRIEAKLKA